MTDKIWDDACREADGNYLNMAKAEEERDAALVRVRDLEARIEVLTSALQPLVEAGRDRAFWLAGGDDVSTCKCVMTRGELRAAMNALDEDAPNKIDALTKELEDWRSRAGQFYQAGIETGIAIGEQNRRDQS